jgi:hypothetical protein
MTSLMLSSGADEREQALFGLGAGERRRMPQATRRNPDPFRAKVAGYEVDLRWRDGGLVVEVDGFAYHSTRAAFERDRLRDAKLQSLGLTVIRVTWRQIVEEPYALVARLAQALSRPRQRLSSAGWR